MLFRSGDEHGLSPAGVVVAWNVTNGVVPIPSSTTEQHIVENIAAARTRLSGAECDRILSLADPEFARSS